MPRRHSVTITFELQPAKGQGAPSHDAERQARESVAESLERLAGEWYGPECVEEGYEGPYVVNAHSKHSLSRPT